MDSLFGFNIQKDQQINFDKNNCRVLNYLNDKVPTFITCVGCGSCTSTCSAGQFTDFNFRKLHTAIRRGLEPDLKKEMSKCMYCGKCQLVCPRGVDNRAVIKEIHLAIEKFKL